MVKIIQITSSPIQNADGKLMPAVFGLGADGELYFHKEKEGWKKLVDVEKTPTPTPEQVKAAQEIMARAGAAPANRAVRRTTAAKRR